MRYLKKNRILIHFLISFLLILSLVFIWFHSGYVLGTGESGLFFYSINNLLEQFGQTWFTATIGFSGNGTPLIDIPFFLFIQYFRYFNIPYVFLQAAMYLILELVGFMSVYAITGRLFSDQNSKKKTIISFLAAGFYIFNQINLVLILNRLQYPFIFFYSLLPLSLYFCVIALEKKKFAFCFLVPLFTFFFATSFAEISSVILFWLVLFLFGVFWYLFYARTWENFLFLIKFFFFSIIIWVFINAWWILPLFQTVFNSPYVTHVSYNTNGDLGILTSLSSSLGNLAFVFRLMHHDFYQWMKVPWNGYYQNPIIILLSFLPPIFVFGSLLIKKKPNYYYFFIFLSLLSIFAIKGIAGPFGEVFNFLFTHIRFLESFRNPFEKFGIVLPLFYTIPFAYGVYSFYEYIKRKFSQVKANISFILIIVICFGFIVLPIWNGWAFTGSTPPSNNLKVGFKVNVPAYYKEANDWLNSQPGDFRVIALPIGEEDITYVWPYGYSGIELSNDLFDHSFISYCTTIQYLCGITHELEPLLLKNPVYFGEALYPLQANYVMLRKDTNYQYDQMQNPMDLEKKFDSVKSMMKVKSFGPLTFYKINQSTTTKKIFAATQGITALSSHSFLTSLPLADYKKNDIYFTDPNSFSKTENQTHQIILQANEYLPPQLTVSKENAIAELPYVHVLPGQAIYPLTRARESFMDFLAGSSNFPNKIEESDKRIVEVYKLLTLGKTVYADKTMQEYNSLLLYIYQNRSEITVDKYKEDLLRQNIVMSDILNITKSGKNSNSVYVSTNYNLNKLLIALSLKPLLPVNLAKYHSYSIAVPENGKYALSITTQDYSPFYKTTNIDGKIDTTTSFSVNKSNQSFTDLGTFYFTKGDHQVDIQIPESTNLLSKNTLKVSTGKGMSDTVYKLKVNNYNPYDRYNLSFDYKIESGNPVQASFVADTDLLADNKVINDNLLSANYTGYKNQWYHYETQVTPSQISHAGYVVFFETPLNNCMKNSGILASNKCNDKNYSDKFNESSSAEIKNISFTRNDLGSIFLTQSREINDVLKEPKISFIENNPARYFINVQNATTPFYLTFLEAYHPLWKLYYVDQDNKIAVGDTKHFLVNSYANAWQVDRLGSYTMLLEFSPQNLFELGTKITISTLVTLLLILLVYILRKRFWRIIRKN
ncbi:MAG TPA: hypothetical protein VMR41_00010 [Patescibacteria group bacterium]|nr:hypothetical protein [Patescibacteria group bacterium]